MTYAAQAPAPREIPRTCRSDEIAGHVGFAAGASLPRHPHAAIGVPPPAYRRTFRTGV